MTIDSLSRPIHTITDTIKTATTGLTNDIHSTASSFDYRNTLFVALIGAVIGQALIIFISWCKSKIDLKTKKRLLFTDLNNQKLIVIRLKKEYEILLNKFEKKDLERYTYDAFEDLHADIYNSIIKTDLFKIFGTRITTVVKIYNTLGFLEKISVDHIYKGYITKLDNHLREKRDNLKHEHFCPTHIGYIEGAIIQLTENIKTSKELIDEIGNFVK